MSGLIKPINGKWLLWSGLALFCFPVFFFWQENALAEEKNSIRENYRGLTRELSRLIDQGGVAVGEKGRVIYSFGKGAYVPASIIKMATALAAFHHLGADYRFKTEVYLTGNRDLIVRGYGDPYLVSEEWELIAEELARRGVFDKPLRDLVMDDSAFSANLEVDGAAQSLNPYDARLGALVSNFNTMFVKIDRQGRTLSAEPQTPLTPLAVSMSAGLPPGRHRINFSQKPAEGLRYSGELAQAFFTKSGAAITGEIREGKTPAGLKPVLIHSSSRPLREGIKGMMEFSNNYIANQILLVMGLESAGTPARMEKGLKLTGQYLVAEIGLEKDAFHIEEGSGLSRKNNLRLLDMLKIVEAFRPWRKLLKFYGKGAWRAQAKTGTLTGVYTLAGYLPGPEKRSFVIMLNQERKTRGAIYKRLSRKFGRPD